MKSVLCYHHTNHSMENNDRRSPYTYLEHTFVNTYVYVCARTYYIAIEQQCLVGIGYGAAF